MSYIPINPNLDAASFARAVNENFRQLENRERTTIYRDDKGVQRIIIGRLPDGTYGIVISKEGQDVTKVFS